MAVDHRAHRGGQGGDGIAGLIHRVDGRAAVVAEALGVELVIGMLRIVDHAVGQGILHVVVAEVEPPLVHAVGGGTNVVIGGVVADPKVGAQGRQHVVLGGRHVLDGLVVLDDVVVLVVIRPTGQDHGAARRVERRDGRQLLRRIGPGVRLGSRQAAGGRGEDQGLVLGVAAGRDELLAAVQLHRAHVILRRQGAEVAHGILVVARHVLVVVGGVDADVDQLIGIQHVQGDVLREGVLLAVLLQDHRHGDGGHPGRRRRVLEGHALGAAGLQSARSCIFPDDLAADSVGHGLDLGVAGLAVEEGGGQGQLLLRDGGRSAAGHVGDAQLQGLAHPDGGSDGDIAVALCDADEVVAVIGIQRHADAALGQLRATPALGHLAGVHHQLHLADGVGLIGIVEGDLKVQLLGYLGDGAAQHLPVDGVADLQVLILGGIDPHGAEGGVDAFLAEIIREDDVAGVVGVAPAALVVILVIAGGQVPALVQGLDVLAVAGIVAAGTDLALAVADLHQVHAAVDNGIPVGKVLEGAEGGAGVVELADGIRALGLAQQGIVGLHARVAGLIIEGRVVPGDDARGIEGVDVAGSAGPGHLKACQRHETARVLRVEGGDRVLIGLPRLLAVFRSLAHVVERALGVGRAGLVKVVGVVGVSHELHIVLCRQSLHIRQRILQAARAVGILGVGVQLAEVELILGLTHGEAPGLLRLLAVRALHCDRHRHLAVRQVGGGGVGDLLAVERCLDGLPVESHRNAGVLASVHDLRGDRRPLALAGLSALGRGHVGDHRLILHGDHGDPFKGHALGVRAAHRNGKLIARHHRHRDGNSISIPILRDGQFLLAQLGGQILHAENGVHGEAQGVVHAHIGVQDGAEVHGRRVHDAAGDADALRHGIEEEGVDGVVRGLVHAVGLIALREVLQELAVLPVELGGPALHLIAAHAAGAISDGPVGVLRCLLAVEGIVAGAVGAEVAVGLIAEAEILPVRLHSEDHAAVGGDCLAVLYLGADAQNGGALIRILRRQHALGALVVEHDRVAILRQIAGIRRRGRGFRRNELHRINALIRRVIEIGAELLKTLAGIGVPLHIVGVAAAALAGGVDDVVAALRRGLLHLPGGVGCIQRQTVLLIVHGKLAAACGGNSIHAVLGADVPDQVCGRIRHLAVRHGDVLTGAVVSPGGIGRHGLPAAGIVDHILPVRHQGLLHGDKLHRIDTLIRRVIKIGAELLKALAGAGVPLHVVGVAAAALAGGVDDVVAALRRGLLHLPGGVGRIQRQTVLLIIHGKLAAVGGGNGIHTVLGADVPDEILRRIRHLAVFHCDVLTGTVVSSRRIGRHGLPAAGIVDDVLPVSQPSLRLGLRVRVLAAVVHHQVELLLKVDARSVVSAPIQVVCSGIPLHAVVLGPSLRCTVYVVDVIGVRLPSDGSHAPVGMGRSFVLQRHAAELILHGQLLALAGSEGIRAVLVDADSPDVRRGVAAELAVCQRHVRTVVIETVIHGGQGLAVGGIEDHHGIAIPEICRRDDPALPLRRRGFQLVERDGLLVRIAAALVVAEAHLVSVCIETQIGSAGHDIHRAVLIHRDRVGRRRVSALQAVRVRILIDILSTGGLDKVTTIHLCDGKGDVAPRRDRAFLDGDCLIVVDSIQRGQASIKSRVVVLVYDQIRARPILRCFRDLHIGLLRRLRCEDRGGQQGQSHHQGHQQRT